MRLKDRESLKLSRRKRSKNVAWESSKNKIVWGLKEKLLKGNELSKRGSWEFSKNNSSGSKKLREKELNLSSSKRLKDFVLNKFKRQGKSKKLLKGKDK